LPGAHIAWSIAAEICGLRSCEQAQWSVAGQWNAMECFAVCAIAAAAAAASTTEFRGVVLCDERGE